MQWSALEFDRGRICPTVGLTEAGSKQNAASNDSVRCLGLPVVDGRSIIELLSLIWESDGIDGICVSGDTNIWVEVLASWLVGESGMSRRRLALAVPPPAEERFVVFGVGWEMATVMLV